MNLKHQKIFISFGIILLSLFLITCGGDEQKEVKTMKQLQDEQGVPVKVKTVESESFSRYISFYSILSGYKESIKGAMVGDRIDKILVSVGSSVQQNQVVMTFPTDNPGMQYEQAKTGFANTEKTYLRTKTLYEAGETSQANFEGIETQYKVEKRNLQAMEQALFIQSPISGKIVEIYVEEGMGIKSETPLFKVAQTDRMIAKFFASEEEVRLLKQGMDAEINCCKGDYKGKITEVSLSMDAMRRAFSIEATFNNPQQKLSSGLTVDVKVKTYSKPNAIVITRNNIGLEGNKKFVFVVNNNVAVKKYITTGEEEGISIEVLSGLSKGDVLITEGTSKLADGDKIKVIN